MKNENSGGRELRVLLIDDDPGDLHLISEALKNYDSGRVEILKSRRFSDGLSRIAVDRPDVILLDLGLPDSTGLESVREILAASPGLPVIILTGLDDEELGPMAVREGAQDYVVKEYADRNLMSHVLRHSVERQGLVNRLERQGKTVLAAHENLKSVIEASGDAILVCEPEGRILFANPMGERLFNGDGNRLIGTSFGFPLTADKKTEIQIPSPGNPVVSAEMHVVDITWHGDPARMVTLHDTTVRKAAEAELSATNRALRASEERFRAFMNASPESMLLKDRDGRYLAVNKEWELRYGKSAKNVIGRLSSDIFPLKKAKRVKTQDDEVFSSGIVCYFEADEVDSAGTKLVEKVVKFPIRDNQGAIVALGGISFDVTDLKRAQEALQRSNRTLRTLSAGNRALVHAKTEESLIANVCKLIVELSGYPFVWVGFTEGEKETALVTVAQYGTAGDGLKPVGLPQQYPGGSSCFAVQAARKNEIVVVQDKLAERDCPTCREFATAYGFCSLVSLPLPNGAGCFGTLTICAAEAGRFDDEEVKLLRELAHDLAFGIHTLRAEERRRSAEAEMGKLQRAVEQSPAMVIITDRAGVIEYVNPKFRQVTGYESAEAVGQNPRLLRSGNTSGDDYARLWEAISTGHEWRGVLQNKRKDGSFYWGETAISPVRSADGKITHYIGIQEDITEKVDWENRLRQSEKMESLGSLAGGIAHDFNNMLLPIMSLASITMRDLPEGSRQRERLRRVHEAAERAQELVHRILAFSRRSETAKSSTKLVDVAQEAVDLLNATLPSTIDLHSHLETDVGMAQVDPAQVQTIILNLASNASDALTGKPGRVDIRLRRVKFTAPLLVGNDDTILQPGFYGELTVKDSGPGIPDRILARIFEPFFTTKAVGEGTGLGLAMVHGIVRDHGGAVTVETVPGTGTEFTVLLPLEAEPVEVLPFAGTGVGHGKNTCDRR